MDTAKIEKERPDLSWMTPGQVVADLETTGLHAERHSIFDVGFIAWNGKTLDLKFRPRPGAEVDARALAVNGMSVHGLDALSMGYFEGMAKCAQFLRSLPCDHIMICGLNVGGMDRPMLAEFLKTLPFWEAPWISHRVDDLHTQAVCWAKDNEIEVPEKGFETDALYKMLSMPPEPRPHGAIQGAWWECHAFARIRRFYNTLTASVKGGES